MKNIAIFASGSGTNAENIARYFANSENVNVAVVLSNNRNVGVHGRVNKLGVPSFVFSREEFIAGVPILEKLAEYDVCLIVLAGFMNKISDVILQAFPGKIVNIHPALLPKYGGKGMYGMHVPREYRMLFRYPYRKDQGSHSACPNQPVHRLGTIQGAPGGRSHLEKFQPRSNRPSTKSESSSFRAI